MFVYWFLFVIPLYFLFGKNSGGLSTSEFEWRIFGFFLVFFIGLRFQVGADWFAYLEALEIDKNILWHDLYLARDPGYTVVSWFSLWLGMDIYGVNLICAAIFTGGLISLCRAQPYPWLAVLVAVPYLVIVVAMGYTRQAAAMGFMMYGFKYLLGGHTTKYLVLILLAGMLHKTAFVFAAFALFQPTGGKLKRVVGVVSLICLVGLAYLVEQVDTFMLNYVQNPMNSAGGQIRVLMNIPPALIILAYWKKWRDRFDDRWFWALIALIGVICLPLASVASTAVDRMALYLIPLQLVVWARLPVLTKPYIGRNFVFIMASVYYTAVMFTWLFYGAHSSYWLPYDNLLISTL